MSEIQHHDKIIRTVAAEGLLFLLLLVLLGGTLALFKIASDSP